MTLSEGRLKLLGDQRKIGVCGKRQCRTMSRTDPVHRVCLVKSERRRNEQKAPRGTGVRETETDREAKRRRQ